ncbi:MAG: TIGR02270 family protein [Candidatus Zixiibacteriota bacterium]
MAEVPPASLSQAQSDILPQYAADAAFLWLLREQAVRAPHYTLAELIRLDERIEAQLDGLRVAGNDGWEAAQQELEWEEPGEVFVAAVPAFESDDMARIQPVLTLARESHELERGLIAALAWIPYRKVALRINQLAAAQTADLRRIGIAAAACHRQDPGRPLDDSLDSDDPRLRARALRAAGQLRRTDLLSAIRKRKTDEDESCRFSAAWSAALLGDRSLVPVLQSVAMGDSPLAAAAMDMALRCLDLPQAHAWRKEIAADSQRAREAVMAASIIGDPILTPELIDRMSDPALARLAGESFTSITGIDLEQAKLTGQPPPESNAGPTDSPEDENVAPDPDENLPWPDPVLVQDWWNKHRQQFPVGTRHLLGQPMTTASLTQVLREGRQCQRIAAALESVLLDPKGRTPLFETRAPGLRQQRILEKES